jgi:hypothetical protein
MNEEWEFAKRKGAFDIEEEHWKARLRAEKVSELHYSGLERGPRLEQRDSGARQSPRPCQHTVWTSAYRQQFLNMKQLIMMLIYILKPCCCWMCSSPWFHHHLYITVKITHGRPQISTVIMCPLKLKFRVKATKESLYYEEKKTRWKLRGNGKA